MQYMGMCTCIIYAHHSLLNSKSNKPASQQKNSFLPKWSLNITSGQFFIGAKASKNSIAPNFHKCFFLFSDELWHCKWFSSFLVLLTTFAIAPLFWQFFLGFCVIFWWQPLQLSYVHFFCNQKPIHRTLYFLWTSFGWR